MAVPFASQTLTLASPRTQDRANIALTSPARTAAPFRSGCSSRALVLIRNAVIPEATARTRRAARARGSREATGSRNNVSGCPRTYSAAS